VTSTRWAASVCPADAAANAPSTPPLPPAGIAIETLSAKELDQLIAAAERRRDALSGAAHGASSTAGSTAEATPSPASAVAPPSGAHQWGKLFIRTALPFFAFGVCDNVIMLSVGDLIDEHFGVIMGFSTLVAAGLGQAVSDGSGVTIQCFIERQAERFRLCDPEVDPRYLATVGAQRILQIFRTVGIVVGCLVGLTPLLLMDTGNKPRMYDLLLKDLSESDRRVVSSEARYVTHTKGEYLCRAGEQVHGLETIVSGEVKVVRRCASGEDVVICEQGPGTGIGFLEVVFEHDSVADVVCETDVRALRIERDVIASRPELHSRFKQHLDEYIRGDPVYTPYLLQRPPTSHHALKALS
jgi:hypothetical protein